MDIKKLDVKKTLMTGTVLAVVSGFIPPVSNTAIAGTATVGVTVDIVTAITLDTTTPLDFGRLAITGGGPISGNHDVTPLGATTTATNASVVQAATPGSFNIAGGDGAGNVEITLSAAVTYNAGNISMSRLVFGGPGMATDVTVNGGATAVAGNFAGGGQTDVQIGGRIVFTGTPGIGAFTGNSYTVNIIDVP